MQLLSRGGGPSRVGLAYPVTRILNVETLTLHLQTLTSLGGSWVVNIYMGLQVL